MWIGVKKIFLSDPKFQHLGNRLLMAGEFTQPRRPYSEKEKFLPHLPPQKEPQLTIFSLYILLRQRVPAFMPDVNIRASSLKFRRGVLFWTGVHTCCSVLSFALCIFRVSSHQHTSSSFPRLPGVLWCFKPCSLKLIFKLRILMIQNSKYIKSRERKVSVHPPGP